VLSDVKTSSFVPDFFENDNELLTSLDEYIHYGNKRVKDLGDIIEKLSNFDSSEISVNGKHLSSLSLAMFSNYRAMSDILHAWAEENLPTVKARKNFCKKESFTLYELEAAILFYKLHMEDGDTLEESFGSLESDKPLVSFMVRFFNEKRNAIEGLIPDAKTVIDNGSISKNRRSPKKNGKGGGKGFYQMEAIRGMLDAFSEVYRSVKWLHLIKGTDLIEGANTDSDFYEIFAPLYEEFSDTTIVLYNKTRSYLTQKPYSKDKMLVNFDAPQLLSGWDINKQKESLGVILKRDEEFYLAIMRKEHNTVFLEAPVAEEGEEFYERLGYKLLPSPSKMLPKVFFSRKWLEANNVPEDILDIKRSKSYHRASKDFSLEDCHRLIDFFKANINNYKVNESDEFGWDVFSFEFSPTSSYQDIDEFYQEVEQQGYKMWFDNISKEYVDECVKNGEIYLFRIMNKDFRPASKGKPNLHTLYWLAIFDDENLENPVIKLNGGAKMYFREHSIEEDDRIIHPANEPIANKTPENPKKESKFGYDIVKDRRFTEDKFKLHVPVTINCKAANKITAELFNRNINKALALQEGMHVIGIDRGERNLLYYVIIDWKGRIIKQGSLNCLETSQGYSIDYKAKLQRIEKDRDASRKGWATIDDIKNLKSGYMSHIVYTISRMMIEYNAIVCLEDLNMGFKHSRKSVERQVYQKFEEALINKLNYLVFKERGRSESGGYAAGYQLTAPFVSFDKLGKQSGVLFYVNPSYTSKTDPLTGFVNMLRPKYINMKKAKAFLKTFDHIKFNDEAGYFEFHADFKKFVKKVNGIRTKWVICTHGDERYVNRRDSSGRFRSAKVNVTEEMKALLHEYGIDYHDEESLQKSILNVDNSKFYRYFLHLVSVVLNMRYSVTGNDDIDFILSPVANANGVFFDSRNADDDMPKDADANGAYHIAMKGLWSLQQIRNHDWDADDNKRLNLMMSNEEWVRFIQEAAMRR